MEFRKTPINDLIDRNRILKYNNPEIEFILFLKDHRSTILSESTVRMLGPTENQLFRYRPKDYLRSINYDEQFDWYVLWLNQIKTVAEFNNIDYLYIPNPDTISSLYSIYRNYKSKCVGAEVSYITK